LKGLSAVKRLPADIRRLPSRLIRYRGRWLLGAALVALIALGFKGWNLYNATHALRSDVQTIETFTRSKPNVTAIASLGPTLAKTRSDAIALRAEAAPLLPAMRWLGWVPTYGPDLAAAEPLLDTAVDLSSAADESFAALSPILLTRDDAQPIGEALSQRVAAARPQLETAREAVARASAAWSHIRVEALSPALRDQLRRVETMLPLAQAGIELAPIVPNFLQDIEALEMLAQAKPNAAKFASFGPLLAKTRGDAAALRAAAAPLFPVARQLGWVPTYGPDLAAAEPLLDAAVSFSRAADESFLALSPVVRAGDITQPINATLVRRLLAARPQIEIARGSVVQAAADWSHVPVSRLSPPLRDRLRGVDSLLSQAQEGFDLALILPNLLGANGQRDYLLIAQNPDELRATGGFISGAGVLRFDDGRVVDFFMRNSNTVDNYAIDENPDPPEPLFKYMEIEQWVFADSNWSPDFPTSAATAAELYNFGQGRDLPNVLGFDPAAIQMFLDVLGPVSVDDFPEPVSAENLTRYMRSQYDAQFQTGSKAFMDKLGKAIIAKIETAPAGLDLVMLARAAQRALDQRHLLLYVEDPATAAILARRGWDGAVQPGSADFLMVVDSNVGYNKINPNIHEELTYTVDLSDLQAPRAELAVRHMNRVNIPGECRQNSGDLIGPDWYEKRVAGCYWDYLRVLIPGGSALIGATTQPIPGAWMMSGEGDDGAVTLQEGERGASVLSRLLVVPAGGKRETILRYRLPRTAITHDDQGWHYRLRIQKQAGREAIPCVVNIRLPPKAAIVSNSSNLARQADGTMRLALALNQDQAVEITFRIP
jgi:hypothetical protein